jgi:hypothetical protein
MIMSPPTPGAIVQRTAEFDAFGPWIYEVRTGAELPRLFHDAGLDPAAFRLVLKVPRNLERRNATPDMHLYDYVIALDYEVLTLLRRQDDRYDTTRIAVDRIIAIEDSVSLLDGRLTLHTADGGATVIPYNAADLPPVHRLIKLLREVYLPVDEEAVVEPAPPVSLDLGNEDIGLVNAYRSLRVAEPGMHLVSAAPRQVVGRSSRLRPVVLHASITVADHREIQLLHRRERLTSGNAKDLTSARTILPRARITAVEVQPHPHHGYANLVTVISGGVALAFPVHQGPETDALLDLGNAR